MQVKNYDEKMECGMELMETAEHDVMAEELYDSKALFAWGPEGGVLSFRGTASFKNCLTDIRVGAACCLARSAVYMITQLRKSASSVLLCASAAGNACSLRVYYSMLI